VFSLTSANMGDGGGAAGNWCLIESDPGVFTELIARFGVAGVQVEELWSLDKEHFQALKPVLGLIFLFKWTPEQAQETGGGSVVTDSRAQEMFFAKQVIQNACATQAILSVLLNREEADEASTRWSLGSTLTSFREFVSSFDAGMKGLTLSNSDEIREVHNSFARQNLFEFDQRAASKDDDVFHFVSYVPIKGRLYELDGIREGPVDHGAIGDGQDWLDLARPIIEQRMARYQAGEIHFNLMALTEDRLQRVRRREEACRDAGDDAGAAEAVAEIRAENERRAKWRKENARRRHNYLPFIVELLKGLAEEGNLSTMYEAAKEKTAVLEAAKKDKKKASS